MFFSFVGSSKSLSQRTDCFGFKLIVLDFFLLFDFVYYYVDCSRFYFLRNHSIFSFTLSISAQVWLIIDIVHTFFTFQFLLYCLVLFGSLWTFSEIFSGIYVISLFFCIFASFNFVTVKNNHQVFPELTTNNSKRRKSRYTVARLTVLLRGVNVTNGSIEASKYENIIARCCVLDGKKTERSDSMVFTEALSTLNWTPSYDFPLLQLSRCVSIHLWARLATCRTAHKSHMSQTATSEKHKQYTVNSEHRTQHKRQPHMHWLLIAAVAAIRLVGLLGYYMRFIQPVP